MRAWRLCLLGLALGACAGPRPLPTPRTFRLDPASLRVALDPRLQSMPVVPTDFDPSALTISCQVALDDSTRIRLADIYAYVAERRPLQPGDPVMVVLGDQQKLYLTCLDQGLLQVEKIYPVSTGERGFSECGAEESKTPVGLHVVYDKEGSGLPEGQIMKSRMDMGMKAEISRDPGAPVYASITSRVMWLGGREPSNTDSYVNLIYIHGTPREYALGHPDSFGCIRMGNQDIIELYDRVPENTPVYIDPRKF